MIDFRGDCLIQKSIVKIINEIKRRACGFALCWKFRTLLLACQGFITIVTKLVRITKRWSQISRRGSQDNWLWRSFTKDGLLVYFRTQLACRVCASNMCTAVKQSLSEELHFASKCLPLLSFDITADIYLSLVCKLQKADGSGTIPGEQRAKILGKAFDEMSKTLQKIYYGD